MENEEQTNDEPSNVVPAEENPIKYAGFWARFFAFILDSIVLSIVLIPILMFVGYDMLVEASVAMFYGQPIDWRRELVSSILTLVITIGFWIYAAATPGKMMMGMSIVDATTGGPASNGKLILRYFAYFVSSIPLFLGFIWIAFDKRKQGFHDKIANTVVIMNPPKETSDLEE